MVRLRPAPSKLDPARRDRLQVEPAAADGEGTALQIEAAADLRCIGRSADLHRPA